METTYTLTKAAILAHPKQLFEARRFKDPRTNVERGEPMFSCTLLFSPGHPDWDAMRKLAYAIAKAEWPGIKWGEFSTPFKTGDRIAEKREQQNARLIAEGKKVLVSYEWAKGNNTMAVKSKNQPRFASLENGKVHEYLDDAAKARARSKFFFGAEVVAQLNFRAYEVGNKSVTCYINNILANGKGKPMGDGGKSAAEVFAGYAGTTSDENPADDDSIPYE